MSGVVSRGQKAINERYRPMRLSELIGNDYNKICLKKWIEKGDLRSRALLLSGQTGGGKTTTARILAMGLNCEKGETTEPCLECSACKAAMNGMAFHIVEHNMSEANTKEAAEAIVASMSERTITGRHKVYILDEVQKLTNSSQNLLLKAVENPPVGVYIFFCTTEADSLIKTLRNRCEHYRYELPNDKDISSLLASVVKQENIELTDDQKRELFSFVKGMSYREILFTLEQFSAGLSVDQVGGKIVDKTGTDVFTLAKEVIYNGNFDAWVKTMNSGQNMEFEGFRLMIRKMAAKEIEKAGFKKTSRAALYYDLVDIIDAKKFYDAQPQPIATAMVWRICAEIKGNKDKL